MVSSTTDGAPGSVADRWERAFGRSGGAGVPVDLAPPGPSGPSTGTAGPTGPTGDRQLEVAELFVRTDPDERRALDLLCLVLVAAARPPDRLVALGPQALRAQASSSVSGLTVLDVPLGPDPGASRVSVAVLRMRRRLRVSQITNAIDELGRVLDYRHDPLGSDAVARTLLSRVAVLVGTSGVRVAVSGTVDLAAAQDGDTHHLLATGPAPDGARPGAPRMRADRLPASVRDHDFVVLRRGAPRPRRARVRSLVELRRQHALAEIGAELGELGEDQSYAARVTRGRQDARARTVVQAVAVGDTAAAVEAYRAGLAVPDAVPALQEGLTSRLTTVTDLWLVDDALAAAEEYAAVPGAAAAQLRGGLDRRLDQLLGLRPVSATESFPGVTPIVTEVADDLVPYVDSRLDGGRFIEQLIPRMRGMIEDDTGVTISGVRLRGNPTLPPGGFVVQIDEVPVLTGAAPVHVRYRVVSAVGAAPADGERQVPLHPLTGAAGVWTMRPVVYGAADPAAGDEPVVDVAQNLLHQIDLAVRPHLATFVGPQELDALLTAWSPADDPDNAEYLQHLLGIVVPDVRARLRLTWVLQSLVTDGVPVDDGRAVLAAVRAVGGLDEPLPVLRRAVRNALRARLPGRGDLVPRFALPADHEAALVAAAHGDPDEADERYSDLLGWLRATVTAAGPVASVVTRSDEAREAVARVAGPLHRFVTVLTEGELAP